MLNHSCLPNVIFGRSGTDYVFVTVRDIEANEEICDNYCDITLDRSSRQSYLSNQYGFTCKCDRCLKNNKKMDSVAKQIERERLSIFGFTKSKKIKQ
jgi:SET domain-containing protein